MQYYLILFLPLCSFLIAGLFGSKIGYRITSLIASGCVLFSAVFSWIVFLAGDFKPLTLPLFGFIKVGSIEVDWAIRIDTLTVVMLVVVNTISALVHIYSIGYMSHDPHKERFFAYLSLFTFAMLALVTSNNLVQMFFGWEGVGLASFLLIGFWYKRPSANAAAMKAFIVNRVGDFGFMLGIIGIYILFGSLEFNEIFLNAEKWMTSSGDLHSSVIGPLGELKTRVDFGIWKLEKTAALDMVFLLLFMGAMGKSAQVPLHTWLADAMEGPTPVSALIHAATMVTAGVFMMARLSPILELSSVILPVVMFIGAITALLAAIVALVQTDIKRVIAWSTCSQLGYMFAAIGAGAYAVGIFHLFTHAFFKALLFLGAGSVIHAVSGEQDMRKMGGLYKYLPVSCSLMIIGTLALTGVGIPGTSLGFSGFFSKEAIIESVSMRPDILSQITFWSLVATACLTGFYSWRLIFMTFYGKPRAEKKIMDHVHESGLIMLIPLVSLAFGAVFSGIIFHDAFIGSGCLAFWKSSILTSGCSGGLAEGVHNVSGYVKWLPLIGAGLGGCVSWIFHHLRFVPVEVSVLSGFNRVKLFLVHGYEFDRLYDFLFVRPIKKTGYFLWQKGDKGTIDRFGPDGVKSCVLYLANRLTRLQSGYVDHYAFAMFLGIAALIFWVIARSLLQ